MFSGGFSFGGSGFPGGFPGFADAAGSSAKEVDNKHFYDILEIDRNASDSDIKKAHRKMVLKWHPDKQNGDAEKIKDVNRAYEVLRDKEKRKLYDLHGEDGVAQGQERTDPFASMFSRKPAAPKSDDITQEIQLTLEEVYTGVDRHLAIERNANCQPCAGTGSRSKVRHRCTQCQGKGVQVVLRQLAPGMVQQVHQACETCKQTGFSVPQDDMCGQCHGKGLVSETGHVVAHFRKGHVDAKPIILKGEAGISKPSLPAGDIVLIPRIKDHAVFKRVGNDLIINQEIYLVEALCGTEFIIDHMDNRKIRAVMKPGEIINVTSVKLIKDEGMPLLQYPDSRGNLYIQFDIKFPSAVTLTDIEKLRQILPARKLKAIPEEEDVEEVDVETVDDIQEELMARSKGQSDDSDDEGSAHGMRGQPVQCAQQ